MDHSQSDAEALLLRIQELEAKLEASRLDYHQVVEKTNFHLKELFDTSNDLIQIFRPTGEFRFVNEAWRNKLGYREDEIGQLKFVDVVHPDYRKATLQNLLKITAGSRLERFETVLRTKYEKNVYVIGKLTCVFEADEPSEFRCVFYDITERFRAERAQSLYYKIANITITQSNLEDFYGKIFQELNDILKVRNFSVAFRTGDNYQYDFWENQHEHTGTKILRRDIERMLANYTFERGKPLIIYREGIEKIALQKRERVKDPIPGIWLGVLIHLEGEPVGVLSVCSYQDQSAYNHKDLELLDFISGQISLSMERKLKEEKIQNQAARLNAIFESSTHQIWSLDHKLRFTSFNQNYAEAFEEYYGTEARLGMSIGEIPLTDNNRKTVKLWVEKYREAFSGKVVNFQTSQRTPGKRKVWRDVFLNPIFLPNGKIEEISVIANDITEKKHSETALKESEEKFRNIFESFQDIYFRCTAEGVISMVSPSVTQVLGFEQSEILGKQITDFFISKTRIRDLFKSLYTHQKVQNFEGTITTKAGEHIDFLSNVRLIKRKSRKLEIEGVARDISALKKTNRELREAKELAERSLQIKERFLANMSHEIRTPMNGIIGVIDLIGATPLSDEQAEYIRTIKKSSDNLMDILNNILDLSKIEAGKMQLKLAPVRLMETFEKVYELYSQQAHLSQNALYYHLDKNMPEYVLADETRLVQILSNLVSNAIKFSPRKGNINMSIRLLEQHQKRMRFKVSVKDSGIGISKADTEKLFQSFSQIDSSSSKNYSGTGLGLVICKELVRSMGGDIGVVSTPGLGSTFWFTFEAAEATAVPASSKKKEEEGFVRQFADARPRILLVDDNDINRVVASTILTKSGCEVVQAESGYEALQKVQEGRYDLIFMDIQMPEMDGIRTTSEMRKMNLPHLPPIVAMTAYSMEEDRSKFLKSGLDDYLSKPIKAASLIEKVKTWLHFEPGTVAQEVFATTTEELIINQNTLNQLYKYGGSELIESVLHDFDEEATEQVARIDAAFATRDFQAMRGELHTLKGNAGTLGIERLSSIARTMENSIKQNKFDQLPPMLEQLHGYLAEFKENYFSLINS